MLAFVILNNIVYKVFYDDNSNYISQTLNDSSWEIDYYSEELKNLDINKESDKEEYISCKTSYDIPDGCAECFPFDTVQCFTLKSIMDWQMKSVLMMRLRWWRMKTDIIRCRII